MISINFVPVMTRVIGGLVCLCLLAGCSTQERITRIEYEKASRTFRQRVVVSADSVRWSDESFSGNEHASSGGRVVRAGEWNSVLETVDGLSLGEIDTLRSPTDRRTFDGAAHTSLVIFTTSGGRFSHGFDDEEPHQSLKALLARILSLR